jgi:hypothetical protein
MLCKEVLTLANPNRDRESNATYIFQVWLRAAWRQKHKPGCRSSRGVGAGNQLGGN